MLVDITKILLVCLPYFPKEILLQFFKLDSLYITVRLL